MAEGITNRSRKAKPWQAWVWDAAGARKVYRSFATLREAKQWRADALRAQHHGARVVAQTDTPTLAEAADDLIAGMLSGRIPARGGGRFRASVAREYRLTFNRYLLPSFGNRRLHEITHVMLLDFAERLHGRGLAPSTIRNAIDPLRVLMRRAAARGLVSSNPCTGLELPSGDAKPRNRVADAAEAEALINAMPDPRDRGIWACAFYAGLRRGELRALRWENVDLTINRIAVRESLDNRRMSTPPKTRAGSRIVPITPRLRHHLAELRAMSGTSQDAYVFAADDGRAFAATTISSRAQRAWRSAGLDPITLHEARHSCISTWIMAGGNLKTVSTMAGHASIAITLDRYGHLLEGAEEDVMRRVTAYLDAR